jgi:hypothetical protein
VQQLITLTALWWSPVGLVLDLLGVGLLGFDLIRVQRMLRQQAAADLKHFETMAEDYGGTESWIADIEKSATWTNASSYEDYHLQDELSFNAERSIELTNELSLCVAGVAAHLSKVVQLQHQTAHGNSEAANKSLRYSAVGLVFIFIGFAFQMLGTLHPLIRGYLNRLGRGASGLFQPGYG